MAVYFNIKNGKLIIDAETLTVSAFNDIWEADTSKTKTVASNMLLYVFHLCDITQRNILVDIPEAQKESLCKRNAFGDADYKFKEPYKSLVENAILWYNTVNNDSVMRMAYAVNLQIDRITEFLMTNEAKTQMDVDNSMDNLKKIKDLLESKKRVDEFVKRQFEQTKVRGGGDRSPLEKGLIGYTPKI